MSAQESHNTLEAHQVEDAHMPLTRPLLANEEAQIVEKVRDYFISVHPQQQRVPRSTTFSHPIV